MQRLLFLLRVAFICNLLFIATITLHFVRINDNSNALSTIITMGLIMAPIINATTMLTATYFYVFQHKKIQLLPTWLYISNSVLLVLEISYIILRNI